jgi:hypothetical protein
LPHPEPSLFYLYGSLDEKKKERLLEFAEVNQGQN